MERWIYGAGVAVVVAVVVWRGLEVNPPTPDTSGRPATDFSRGHKATDSLEKNLSVQSVSAASSESLIGSYPPRGLGLAAQRKPPSDSWLLDADSDRERFRRLEVVLRDMDPHMVEIGLRFGIMHDAIGRDNLKLALMELDRTVETAEIGLLKRPGFNAGAGAQYLGIPQWQALRAALESGDGAGARAAFLKVRETCISCHTAQGLDFINNSATFDTTASFADQAQ